MSGPTQWSAVVTTARRPLAVLTTEAHSLAGRMGAVFVERGETTLESIANDWDGLPVVVVEQERVVCYIEGEVFFFHPGLARIRMEGMPRNHVEPLLSALDVREGDRVLDATLGRAGDAILIASAVGPNGSVTGLEASPVVAELVRLGLAGYSGPTSAIETAMRRIRVVHADYHEYLARCETGSFDQIYFDPMFDVALPGCQNMDPLRPLASHQALTAAAVKEALRTARRRVVVKGRRRANTLEELECPEITGGRWSRVSYGIWRVQPSY